MTARVAVAPQTAAPGLEAVERVREMERRADALHKTAAAAATSVGGQGNGAGSDSSSGGGGEAGTAPCGNGVPDVEESEDEEDNSHQ